jgi:hypothetical protein
MKKKAIVIKKKIMLTITILEKNELMMTIKITMMMRTRMRKSWTCLKYISYVNICICLLINGYVSM